MDDDQERGILQLNNCRLQQINFKDSKGNRIFGFILSAKGKRLDFFSFDLTEIEEWVAALASNVIMLYMNKTYSIDSQTPIGEGSSCIVHRIVRKNNRDQVYAKKSIYKSYLKKNQ